MSKKGSNKPVVFLKGKRIYLRPIEEGDLSACQRWINDPDCRRYLISQLPMNASSEQSWLKSLNVSSNPSTIALAIVLKRGDRFIGNTELHRIDWLNRHAESGAMIGEAGFRDQGYGSEAKTLMLEYAFNSLGLHRISSSVFAKNLRSLAYLKKAGYREEGVRRERFFRNGEWIDEILLGILAQDWRDAQRALSG